MNHIRLMMSLKMMGLTLGFLVRVIFLFALKNPLVVLVITLVMFVAWVLEFLVYKESRNLVTFFRWLCSCK